MLRLNGWFSLGLFLGCVGQFDQPQASKPTKTTQTPSQEPIAPPDKHSKKGLSSAQIAGLLVGLPMGAAAIGLGLAKYFKWWPFAPQTPHLLIKKSSNVLQPNFETLSLGITSTNYHRIHIQPDGNCWIRASILNLLYYILKNDENFNYAIKKIKDQTVVKTITELKRQTPANRLDTLNQTEIDKKLIAYFQNLLFEIDYEESRKATWLQKNTQNSSVEALQLLATHLIEQPFFIYDKQTNNAAWITHKAKHNMPKRENLEKKPTPESIGGKDNEGKDNDLLDFITYSSSPTHIDALIKKGNEWFLGF